MFSLGTRSVWPMLGEFAPAVDPGFQPVFVAGEGANFAENELGNVRDWLSGKAISIYGGSFEVQNNIISKNILGLPETTQKG